MDPAPVKTTPPWPLQKFSEGPELAPGKFSERIRSRPRSGKILFPAKPRAARLSAVFQKFFKNFFKKPLDIN